MSFRKMAGYEDEHELDYYEEGPGEEEIPEDEYSIHAKERILQIISEEGAVTERELKVRLERDAVSEKEWGMRGYFPWVTGFALRDLSNAGKIRKKGYRAVGRPRKDAGKKFPNNFFVIAGTSYDEVRDIIKQKRDLTGQINSLLTEAGVAGPHAENLFQDAFSSLGFDIKDTDVSEYNGLKARPKSSGQPMNLDFLIDKDSVTYGSEIKNWIRYEHGSKYALYGKTRVATDLKITPFMIARYVDDDTMYRWIDGSKGLVFRYWDLLIPESFAEFGKKVSDILGYPIIATDVLPEDKIKEISDLHSSLI